MGEMKNPVRQCKVRSMQSVKPEKLKMAPAAQRKRSQLRACCASMPLTCEHCKPTLPSGSTTLLHPLCPIVPAQELEGRDDGKEPSGVLSAEMSQSKLACF